MKRMPGTLLGESRLHPQVEVVFATSGPSHFFGYYDKTPLSDDGRYLLCHRVAFEGRMVEAQDRAELGLWDLLSGCYEALAITSAFNWQQGSMAQWVPGTANRRIIFNDCAYGRPHAVLLDRQTREQARLAAPIYALSPDGTYALTSCFIRITRLHPGYGYAALDETARDGPGETTITRLELGSGTTRPILDLADLDDTTGSANEHLLEHLLISPDGRRFIFLQRWREGASVLTRLYSCGSDGRDRYLYPDTGFYSHATWLDGEHFMVWGRQPGAYARLRRKPGITRIALAPLLAFYRRIATAPGVERVRRNITSDMFLRFKVGRMQAEPVARQVLTADGHPGVCPTDRDNLLVDTYDDAQGFRHLLLFNCRSGAICRLGSFFSPPAFNRSGYRCDLHPRWTPSGRHICIDTVVADRRQVVLLSLEQLDWQWR